MKGTVPFSLRKACAKIGTVPDHRYIFSCDLPYSSSPFIRWILFFCPFYSSPALASPSTRCSSGPSREEFFDALYARRCYGATAYGILVDFRADGCPMGSEISTEKPVTFTGEVSAYAPIACVEIIGCKPTGTPTGGALGKRTETVYQRSGTVPIFAEALRSENGTVPFTLADGMSPSWVYLFCPLA